MNMNRKKVIVFVSGISLAAISLSYYGSLLFDRSSQVETKQGVGVRTSITGLGGDGTEMRKSDDQDRTAESVTLYGTVSHFSTSGSMKFYFDKGTGRGRLPNGDTDWFWGNVDSPLDQNYIGNHPGETFELSGERLKDDCGYIGDGTCIEQYNIYSVVVAK